jgi:hypothetical protein
MVVPDGFALPSAAAARYAEVRVFVPKRGT